MKSKRRLLEKSRLYVIVDKDNCKKRSFFEIVKKIKDGGADIIQYRDKSPRKECILENALRLKDLIKESKPPHQRLWCGGKTIFIVNDYLDVAKIIDSDGLHLGQGDIPIEIARKILGKDKIIGVSCHNLRQTFEAQNRGADYISIGPIFSTPTKPESKAIGLDLLKEIRKKIRIPIFVIGGINENNINKVLSCGAKRVAICRAICQAKNISFVTKKFYKILHESSE